MIAIVTKQDSDGTYPNVGMSSRTITKAYKSVDTLIRYGVPKSWKNVRLELFANREAIYGNPFKVVYVSNGFIQSVDRQ